MDLVIKIISAIPALILVFFIWPIALGITLGIKRNVDRYLLGFASVQAAFFLLYIPAIVFAWSSRTLSYTAAITITVISIVGVIVRCLNTPSRLEFFALNKPNYAYFKNVFMWGAIIIIAFELWTYITKEPWIYGDDVSYITRITSFVDSNAIYTKASSLQIESTPLESVSYKAVFTSYYPYLGMISILTNLHPLILCKTIIPLIYLPTHYLIVWRIGKYLFGAEENDKTIEKQSLFLFLYAALIEFGQISYYTMSRRVVIWIYNSKSDFFTLLLPILFFYTFILLIENKETEKTTGKRSLYFRLLLITILAVACNSSTLMGVLMSPIVMSIWYIMAAIKTKNASVLFSSLWTFIPHIVTGVLLISFTGFTLE